VTQPLDPAAYLLSEKRSAEIFHDRIVPTLLADANPQTNPVLIVLTAQPGAGKSTLSWGIAASFPDDARPVIIDVDSFRPFYPNYVGLRQEHGWQVDDLVQADARRWLDSSLEYLADRRANVIAEHGLRDRDVTNALLDRFVQRGEQRPAYRIEMALLATPAAESRLGMLERYQVGFERAGLGRYVSEDMHDARYRHVAVAAQWLADDPRLSGMAVYRRGFDSPVYRNDRTAVDQWRHPAPIGEVLDNERNHPWSVEQSNAFLRLHSSLTARMADEWEGSLAAVRDLATPLLHPEAGVPTHDKPAVTFGRYQIVSIAHLDTVRTILMDWPTVEVGVLDLDARPATAPIIPEHLQAFYDGCEANTAPAKNQMTAQERASFWQATIDTAGLSDRVTVRIIGRPEMAPDEFNRQYPADSVDLVFPTSRGEGFDLIRNASFEEILGRPVTPVDPPLEYHTSDIRAAYRSGNDAWRHGFAPGGLEAFVAADGPRRLLGERQAEAAGSGGRTLHVAMHAFPQGMRATDQRRNRPAPASEPPRPARPRSSRGDQPER
jgi:UDP-N-acetylglucosamine kinase